MFTKYLTTVLATATPAAAFYFNMPQIHVPVVVPHVNVPVVVPHVNVVPHLNVQHLVIPNRQIRPTPVHTVPHTGVPTRPVHTAGKKPIPAVHPIPLRGPSHLASKPTPAVHPSPKHPTKTASNGGNYHGHIHISAHGGPHGGDTRHHAHLFHRFWWAYGIVPAVIETAETTNLACWYDTGYTDDDGDEIFEWTCGQ
jgi:hypothetical protein